MKNIFLPLVPLLLTPIPAVGQEPKAAPKPTAAIELQSLQAMLTDTVYVRSATAADGGASAAGGSAHDTAFARIRDAEFAADGRLIAFLVDAPPSAKVPASSPRTLTASSVRWDPSSRRWLTTSATMQWAELPESTMDAGKDVKDKQPASLVARSTRMASELLRCVPDAAATKAGKVAEASTSKDPKDVTAVPRVVWWFAPGPQQLAAAVLPAQGTNVVVPWSALRVEGTVEAPRVHVEPAASFDTAPKCTHADQVPDHALRLQAYTHFGVTPPVWDRAPGESPEKKPSDGGGKERGKG